MRRSSPSSSITFRLHVSSTAAFYTLSLHDALPISRQPVAAAGGSHGAAHERPRDACRVRGALAPRRVTSNAAELDHRDRKSTRLNSSHVEISYAVFCLKKKISKDRSFSLIMLCSRI